MGVDTLILSGCPHLKEAKRLLVALGVSFPVHLNTLHGVAPLIRSSSR